MKWFVLLLLAMAPAAYGQPQIYYCTLSPTIRATVYVTDLFTVPQDTPVGRVESAYAYYLATHFKETQGAPAKCKWQVDMRQGSNALEHERTSYRDLRWRIVETHWQPSSLY